MKDGVIRRTKFLRERSGLNPGGQLGHKGHMKGMVSTPYVVKDEMSDFCNNCDRDLFDIKGELDYVSQIVDLPIIT